MVGLRFIILVLGMFVGTIAIPVAPAQAATAEAEYASSAFKATNNKRTHRDLRALERSQCLQRFAVKQATKMANQGRMFHQALAPIQSNCDLPHVGENVAYGFPSGQAVVAGWMRSPGHRANILDADFRLMGIAARQGDGDCGAPTCWYVSQVFGN